MIITDEEILRGLYKKADSIRDQVSTLKSDLKKVARAIDAYGGDVARAELTFLENPFAAFGNIFSTDKRVATEEVSSLGPFSSETLTGAIPAVATRTPSLSLLPLRSRA